MTMGTFYAAMDIGGSSIKGMLATRGHEKICSGTVPTVIANGAHGIIEGVLRLTSDLMAKADLAPTDLAGIGVSSFGFIDAERGVGIKSLRLDIEGFPYVDILTRRLGVPAVIDNDARMAVLGEMRFGAAAGHRDIVQFTLGTALATGMVIDGKLVRGRNNVAGEVSHFVIETTGGLTCTCGRKGCARTYVSARAMKEHALELMEEDRGSRLWAMSGNDKAAFELTMLADAISAGDRVAVAVRDRLVLYLASLCSSTMFMLNPGIVIIGGGVSNLGEHLMVPLRARIQQDMFYPAHDCPVTRAALGAESGMYGALAMISDTVSQMS